MATKTNNRVFHNHLVQEAIDELMSTSYFFFMERIKKYDLNSGVYFDRYVSPYLNDFYRDSIQKTYLGYTERDSDAISVSNATKSLDEQYNYDIDDDGYSKIDVESNCSDMKNPESIYILNENKEGSSVLEKYIDDKGYELEEKDLFYFNFINSFMGGPDIISPEFYTKEINFFFGEKEPEMVQE